MATPTILAMSIVPFALTTISAPQPSLKTCEPHFRKAASVGDFRFWHQTGMPGQADDVCSLGVKPTCHTSVFGPKPSLPCNALQSAKLIMVGSCELEECHA